MSENTIADIEEKEKNGTEDSQEPELSSADGTEEEDEESGLAELQDLREKYLRLSADFENYKKRLSREKQETLDFRNAQRLKELLFVLDAIEKAIEFSKESLGEKTDFVAFLDGIKLVHTQLLAGLGNFGVTAIDSSKGTSFDPSYHEAVYKEPSETYGSGIIISEVQKGYLLNGRLLRPSMVSVSQGSKETSGEDSEEKN